MNKVNKIGTNYTGSYTGIISETKEQFKTTTECTPVEPLLKGFGKWNPTIPCGPNFTYKDHGDFGFTRYCERCPQDTHGCGHEKRFCRNSALESKSNGEYCKSSDVIGATVTKNCRYIDVKKRVAKSSPDTSFFFPGYPPSSLGKPFGLTQIYPAFGKRNIS
ncbi:hypothetical protein M758_5G148100 [Ceratodon purpureus]|uniref:Uncharacterized protein n=1 Tax=Ceratodon purpureus TaxID=3225 RepID=A0A8T0I3B2_CERPU|nr:hypothetical protein KC19_5G155100 [Ceratodon purpureus]KAG0616874.1 hypothetical protein M758_5G148100 [Ceratodon purpureus]